MSLSVDIRKRYKNFSLEVAFETAPGETLALLGASGSGKSVTLKCVAGLLTPDEGRIVLNGRVLFDSAARVNLRPQARHVGYLFQSYALFPNMTVRQNIEIARRAETGGGSGAGGQTTDDLLRRMELTEQADQYPVQLSGGQQQRAALARIYAYEPELLLLDEPFSALDTYLRENMQAELMREMRGYAGDVVLVTHSRDEAYKIARRLVILDAGRPVACGETAALFQDPVTAQAARITGCKNISPIRKTGDTTFFAEAWGLELDAGREVLPAHTHAGIRAHDFGLKGSMNSFPIVVEDVMEGPFDKNVLFRAGDGGGGQLWWITDKGTDVREAAALSIAPEHILLLQS